MYNGRWISERACRIEPEKGIKANEAQTRTATRFVKITDRLQFLTRQARSWEPRPMQRLDKRVSQGPKMVEFQAASLATSLDPRAFSSLRSNDLDRTCAAARCAV